MTTPPLKQHPGQYMARESAEAGAVFMGAVAQPVATGAAPAVGPIYTVARGSSDAAALVLAYEFMQHIRFPVTSLPPSVFSIGAGVDLAGASVLVISQSGASDDLVRTARGARDAGSPVLAITNVAGSAVEDIADVLIPIGAGPELAVPATKTVVGSIGAGMALLASMKPDYRGECERAALAFEGLAAEIAHPASGAMTAELLRAQNVFVIGRGAGYGAAQEVALKLKETCALQAEAYSASEVLHGPLQMVTKPLTVLILDTGEPATLPSIDEAEARFNASGATVRRVRPGDLGCEGLAPAAAAAVLLCALYPVILKVSLSLGFDPDMPTKLAKVTRTA